MTNIFATPANFNRPLYQSQDFIRTLNIFTFYLSSLLLILPKKFNFKALFYFQKSEKGDPWQRFFATSANFNRPLYQSQDFIRTLIFFHIIWAPYYWFSTKKLILKHIFYFLKSVKEEPLTKFFATPANFNGPLC